ncbi:MAG: DUF4175 family protein, partial [Alphaproteobacteria bacterium]|nr:DUF4175 family protein [Alphaproteobacteria bacterium]
MTTPPLDRLRHALRLQRLSMLAEQLWAALQGPLWLAVLACALLWSGLLESLPRPLPFIILVALALTFAWSLRPLAKLRQPAAANVLRKLDAVNGLENREASSLGDQLVEGSGAAELWEAHLERKLSALLHLQLAWPASRWRNFDPLALRVPIAIAALSAFLLGGGTLSSGVINAAQLTTPVPAKPVTLDAWAKPPAYTGKPPLLLTSPAFAEKLKAGEPISLPENSGFSLRLANAAEPKVEVVSPGGNTAVALAETKTGKAESGFTFEARLDKPATIRVIDGAREVASFPISLVVDAPPKI